MGVPAGDYMAHGLTTARGNAHPTGYQFIISTRFKHYLICVYLSLYTATIYIYNTISYIYNIIANYSSIYTIYVWV